MSNFNKYLQEGEVLKLIFKPLKNKKGLYGHLFLLLLAFFVIYPLWRYGRQGFYLWAVVVIYILIRIIGNFLQERDIYLLTNKRLLYLSAVNKKDFRLKRALKLSRVELVKKKGKNSLVILVANKPYYLSGIEKRNQVFETIQIYLKRQNLL